LREEPKLRVSENRVWMRIFGIKRDEEIGVGKKSKRTPSIFNDKKYRIMYMS
jgi:hypothetical protein